MKNRNKEDNPRRHFVSMRANTLVLALAFSLSCPTTKAHAGFAAQGQGMQTVLQNTIPNGALFMESRATWSNAATPAKPYLVDAWFAFPACDAVPVSRLVMTVWGGTAAYTCSLGVQINGTNLPLASPLTFGSTNDTNTVFSATAPSVYGSGSGVWLIGLPVPDGLLLKNGVSNHVAIAINSTDGFDGRINQVTLVAVCQSASLNNNFSYAIAEGSGDIYRVPTAPQVDARTNSLGLASTNGAMAARLRALYTYADIGQNDRLYFNGVQLGSDDVAGWDKTASGLDYGPTLLSYDVLGSLAVTNTVKFSVAAADVPGTRESSLRPQLAVLEVIGPATPPALAIAQAVVITWPASASGYQLESRPNPASGAWSSITNAPAVITGQNTVILPYAHPQQVFQLRKTN
jgi:hypothetical protein